MANEIPNVGQDKSMEVALATKMQLILDQPMSDIMTKLTNRDFEGDFFKIGDTVSIVKPDLESVTVELGSIDSGTHKKDLRLTASDLVFSKNTLQIDRYAKYAFILSDITKAEGKWNYESGNLDIAAYKIRKAHNLELCQLLVDNATEAVGIKQDNKEYVQVMGTPSNPVQISGGDDLYTKVLVPMHSMLYNVGAITADGQVTYGSNPQEGKATKAGMFLPMALYNQFLTSEYFTDRATQAADEKVATGDIAKVLGIDVNIEPSLNPLDTQISSKVTVVGETTSEGQQALADRVVVIVAGTTNTVTKAGKVLPPDSFRSHERFGTEFHGLEIYGQKIFEGKSCVVAFVQLPA